MARAAASARWDAPAAILCKLHNMHRQKDTRPEPYSSFHPYLAKQKKPPVTTPKMLLNMRSLFDKEVVSPPP